MIAAWLMNLEVPIANLTEWLHEVDSDGNGSISVRELMSWIKEWYNGH